MADFLTNFRKGNPEMSDVSDDKILANKERIMDQIYREEFSEMPREKFNAMFDPPSSGSDDDRSGNITSGKEIPEKGVVPNQPTGASTSENNTGTGAQKVRRGLLKGIESDATELGRKIGQNQENMGTYAQDFGRGLAAGVTMGWNDEAYGALKALLAEGKELVGGEESDFTKTYEGGRDEVRSGLKESYDRSPMLTGIGEATGIVGTSFVPGGLAARGASLAGKGLVGVGGGVISGGTYGAGVSEEDTARGLLEDAAIGAAIGGAAGPVLGASGKVAGAVIDKAGTMGSKFADRAATLAEIPSRSLKFGGAVVDEMSLGITKTVDRGAKAAMKEKGPIRNSLYQMGSDMGGSGGMITGLTGGMLTGGAGAVALPAAAGGAKMARMWRKIGGLSDDPMAVMQKAQGTKFEVPVREALGKGKEAVAATMYILMNDPEFRATVGIDLSEENK
jgi:hypothetical protein